MTLIQASPCTSSPAGKLMLARAAESAWTQNLYRTACLSYGGSTWPPRDLISSYKPCSSRTAVLILAPFLEMPSYRVRVNSIAQAFVFHTSKPEAVLIKQLQPIVEPHGIVCRRIQPLQESRPRIVIP